MATGTIDIAKLIDKQEDNFKLSTYNMSMMMFNRGTDDLNSMSQSIEIYKTKILADNVNQLVENDMVATPENNNFVNIKGGLRTHQHNNKVSIYRHIGSDLQAKYDNTTFKTMVLRALGISFDIAGFFGSGSNLGYFDHPLNEKMVDLSLDFAQDDSIKLLISEMTDMREELVSLTSCDRSDVKFIFSGIDFTKFISRPFFEVGKFGTELIKNSGVGDSVPMNGSLPLGLLSRLVSTENVISAYVDNQTLAHYASEPNILNTGRIEHEYVDYIDFIKSTNSIQFLFSALQRNIGFTNVPPKTEKEEKCIKNDKVIKEIIKKGKSGKITKPNEAFEQVLENIPANILPNNNDKEEKSK